MFYKLAPEVAGGLGSDTVFDRSQSPPIVRALHYELDGWPDDDLITSFPCFIVTDRMKKLIEDARASGCCFGAVKVTTSEQFKDFEEFHQNQKLPRFSWLIIDGVAHRDDFGLSTDGSLVVSEKALQVLKSGHLDHCDIVPI
jgi:hypothetical protein